MRRSESEQSLEELAGLADAAGADVVVQMLQERSKPDPATFIGSGKVSALGAACAEADVDVVIVDNELSPAQLRQLEERLDRKVIDRTQLILDIFDDKIKTADQVPAWLDSMRTTSPQVIDHETVGPTF